MLARGSWEGMGCCQGQAGLIWRSNTGKLCGLRRVWEGLWSRQVGLMKNHIGRAQKGAPRSGGGPSACRLAIGAATSEGHPGGRPFSPWADNRYWDC